MLHAIELGHATWPKAILYGVVNVLAKNDGAAPVDRFRPVAIFSVIYRTRAVGQSSLKTIASLAHSEDGRGSFMPGCEPSQLWLVLQAEIEQTLQVHGDLCGLSTDLTRAFNFIPRQHSFSLAEHLGAPARVIVPWKSFLDQCTRAFDIIGHLSSCTTSSCGLPEGDAIECLRHGSLVICVAPLHGGLQPISESTEFCRQLEPVDHCTWPSCDWVGMCH